jgi:hypothetical protein
MFTTFTATTSKLPLIWRKSYGVRPARDDSSNPDVYTSHTNAEDEPSIDQIHQVHPVSPMDAVNGNKNKHWVLAI